MTQLTWQLQCIALLLLCFACQSTAAPSPHQLHWQHRFTPAEQQKLSLWLKQASAATTELLGPYPFTMQFYLYSRPALEPVPWANTWRDSTQQVHFYVAAGFSLEQFLQDWTAYHEISHLALPFLGKEHAWFAEGFASFMQYQVMQRAGLIASAKDAIAAKFGAHKSRYASSESLRDNATRLLAQRRYAAGYWAGAQYFVVADKLLQEQQKPELATLIKQYQQCCRLRDNSLTQVIISLDKLSDSKLFSELLQRFSEQEYADFTHAYQL